MELEEALKEIDTLKAENEKLKKAAEKAKANKSLTEVVKEYQSQIESLKKDIADRDDTIKLILGGKNQDNQTGGKSTPSDKLKKYLHF